MRALAAALLGLAALAALPSAAAEEGVAPEALADVAVVGPRPAPYVHQPFTLTLRVGIDERGFEDHVVPLFARAMDVPVQVLAPALSAFDGVRALPASGHPDADAPTFALGDAVVRADHAGVSREGGRQRLTFELSRRFVADTPGRHELLAPTLRFAFADEVVEDFLGARVAEQSRLVEIHGEPLVLEVRSLPDDGRPPGFVDAVGDFTMHARLVDDEGPEATLHLQVVLEGRGNLLTLTPPSFERVLPGKMLGVGDEPGEDRRVFTVDLASAGGLPARIPALGLAYFDPWRGVYRTARTEPIPLGPAPSSAPAGGKGTPPPPGEFPWPRVLLVTALALVVLAVVLAFLRRRRSRAVGALPAADEGPDPRVWEKAASDLHAALDDPAADLQAPWAAWLAGFLHVEAAAVVGEDLARRLERAGVEAPLAVRIQASLEALVASRYGGAARPDVRQEIRALLDRLPRPAAESDGP